MNQPPNSPPPYTHEYGKPPPYFSPEEVGSSQTGTTSTPNATYPAGSQYTIAPQPPPPYHSRIETEQHQQAGRGPTVIAVTTTPAYIRAQPEQHTVLVLGNCPSCRIGFLQNEFNICGILMAIVFFPVGILCCLCMMDKRCSHCGARF